jgi:pyridoxamine 5'-phosphate oxidase
MQISDIRREYTLAGLRRRDLETDPMRQFQKWFETAVNLRSKASTTKDKGAANHAPLLGDVNAMTLATADKKGRPSSRIVLLKGISKAGFVFYTNYNSRKGSELTENPCAALTFFWPELERQVCVAGKVVKGTRDDSTIYFKSRPRGSQLAAWASNQSEAVADRGVLESRLETLEHRFARQEVPLPPHWGGFILIPSRVEFWQGRPNRLHDRFRYQKRTIRGWKIERLAP